MKFRILLVCYSLWFAASLAHAEGLPVRAASPLGRWVTASGNLEVEVAPCGEALCGTVVRVLANRSMSREGGEMKPADSRDPLGMKILSDFVPTEFRGAREDEPTEWKGTIYNRENAKTYRCIMWIGDAGELMLHPYVGLSWFGRTSAWARPEVALGEVR
jgi:uncharacterized protein (DUF2147 family)